MVPKLMRKILKGYTILNGHKYRRLRLDGMVMQRPAKPFTPVDSASLQLDLGSEIMKMIPYGIQDIDDDDIQALLMY